ncbi:hypothetical protein T439DRAFT_323450 [Meredithblackwellia eburnea MCA 4105]
MGLFSKKNSANGSKQQQQYAPPAGPPPPSHWQGYGQPPLQQQQQPQYYAPPSGPPPPSNQINSSAPAREDPLAALAKYDTHFLIDDSESMEMFWEELSVSLSSVIGKACIYDSDGVDISFFNNRTVATSHNAAELIQLFRRVEPRKSTPTASALKRVLEPYMDNLDNWVIEGKPTGFPRPKPLNLIVLTDGAPDRNEDPEPIIVEIAKRLDKGRHPPFQIGISFVQIGVDEEAADHLRSLDDDLKSKHGIRDFVDTTLFDVQNGQLGEPYILKALLGGMSRSLDKQTL